MSFFIKKNQAGKKSIPKNNKRKIGAADGGSGQTKSKKKRNAFLNEEIDSDAEEEIESGVKRKREDEESSSEEETAQEKKLRLTKEYLAQLEAKEKEKEDADEIDKDAISHRLKEDVLEQSGKLFKQVSHEYSKPSLDDLVVLRGHQLAVTCLVVSPDHKHIYSGSKDCSIIKWDAQLKKKVKVILGGRKGTEATHKGHTGHVLSLAISSDNKFLASGGRDKVVHIWNPETLELIHTFRGHRDAVSGLAFRKNTHQLFSTSHDRSVKLWNLDEMAYIETLFGHQDGITSIDSLVRERAITSGGRDGSVRIWKVVEESQLVFAGHRGSIECVKFINEELFLSGGEDGCLALWSIAKKKPITLERNAHLNQSASIEEQWICSIGSLHCTDVVASGSRDGYVRFWQCSKETSSLKELFAVPVKGFINSLEFASDGTFLVAGVGQEHRLGRWWRLKEAKNSIVIIPLKKSNGYHK